MDFERTRRKLLNIAMEAEEENKPQQMILRENFGA